MVYKPYPLVNIQKLWKLTIFHGKTIYKWRLSIVMLNYQRVYIDPNSSYMYVYIYIYIYTLNPGDSYV